MTRLLVATCVFAFAATSSAQDVPLEYRVKAAYLLNFTRFVEWPAAAFQGNAPFNICVARMNPFGPVLGATLSGETAAGRTLTPRIVQDDPMSCQVLFVPRGVAAAGYLRRVRMAPVLTVGESPNFTRQGGIVNFVLEDGKVRFEINQEAATRSQLTISSRLLKLAKLAQQAEAR
jgi:hypothetical protein